MKKHSSKDFERCSLNMQFYCIDPDKKKYDEICGYTKIKFDIGTSFDVWKKAVEQDGYEEMKESLLNKLEKHPTPTVVDNVWYMFFATGDTSLLLKLYKVGSHPEISKDNAEMYMDMFIQFTAEYKKKLESPKLQDSQEPHIIKLRKGLMIVDKIVDDLQEKVKPFVKS